MKITLTTTQEQDTALAKLNQQSNKQPIDEGDFALSWMSDKLDTLVAEQNVSLTVDKVAKITDLIKTGKITQTDLDSLISAKQ